MSARIGRRSARIINGDRFSRTFTLTQESTGSRGSDGLWIDGIQTSTTLKGSIQPSTDKERLQLPEGERAMEAITVYINTTDKDAISPIKVGSTQNDSDLITVDSLVYAVRSVTPWFDFGHLQAIATRLEDQDG